MGIPPDFIHNEIARQTYEISLHADDERIADDLPIVELEFVLSQCKILEQYTDDPRGESCLAVGYTHEGTLVHVVCGKNSLEHLLLITVYIPTMPRWKDPHTRNR